MLARQLRILYCGNFEPPHSTENHVAASLESIGHEVIRSQENSRSLTAHAQAAIDASADLWLFTRTWHDDWPDGLAALDMLRQANICTVSYHLDLYLGLDRQYQVTRDNPFWASDFVFTADGDPAHAAEFARRGINHHWIAPGVYLPECYIAEPNPRYSGQVAFVGSWQRYHHEWPYRMELIRYMKTRFRNQFVCWPRGRAIRGHYLNQLYASIPVIVGDSCNPGFNLKRYWSDRCTETLGRGGFLIHPRIDGIEDFYTDGKHLVLYDYRDFKGLADAVSYYLSHPDERETIRQAGHEHVKTYHNYNERCRQWLSIVAEHNWRVAGWPFEPAEEMEGRLIREMFEENVYHIEGRDLTDKLVIDIGANIGIFSYWAAQKGARVVAVEPHPESMARAQESLAAFDGQITYIPKAVTGDGQPIDIIDRTDWSSASYTRPGTTIESVTLDELLAPYDKVDVVKIDTEGAEYDIILGASDATLAKVAYFAIECHGAPDWDRREDADRPPDHIKAWSAMVARLAETHRIDVLGRPSVGAYCYAERYPT